MEAVLDTVSFQHLIRKPKKMRKRQNQTLRYETSLDLSIRRGALRIVIDARLALVDEWIKTCGRDLVAVFMSRWEPLGVFIPIRNVPSLDQAVARKLRQLGFNGTIDKLVLRLGIASTDKTVVSEDSHFWDPKTPSKKGDPSSPVACLCFDRMGVSIILLQTLIQKLRLK